MKLKIDTNIQSFVSRNCRVVCLFSLYAFLVGLMVLGAYIYEGYKPLFRDFVIANTAYVLAGDKQPFTEEEAGYTGGFKLDKDSIYTYGIGSNSEWVAEYVRLIVPYMEYEYVTGVSIYPVSAAVVPMVSNSSFHVAGRMYPSDGTLILNERYFLDNRWSDKRRALETLVHELVHIQGGAYIEGQSAELEAATSTATVEVLAGMCNYGDPLACDAFWHSIEGLARSSLLVQLHDLGNDWFYDFWADTFWRDKATEIAYDKSMRHWADDPEGLMTIRRKYNLVPWKNVVYGVAYGVPLNTGHAVYDVMMYSYVVIGMPFDDTAYLLQGLFWILR